MVNLQLVATCTFAVAAATVSAQSSPTKTPGPGNVSPVEAIYVVRSVLQSGVPEATDSCSQTTTGFDNVFADNQYSFRSIAIRGSDGLVMDASVQTVGTIHACFGRTADAAVANFYGEGRLGGVAYKGNGECRATPDYPERGVNSIRCFLDLGALPDGYVGGRLTTNTINTPARLVGESTDPPGYIQSSIATVRLWKRRE